MEKNNKEIGEQKIESRRIFGGRIGQKLILGMFLISIVPLFISGILAYSSTRDTLISDELASLEDNIRYRSERANLMLGGFKTDLSYLNKTPALQGFIRARDNGNIDPFYNVSGDELLKGLNVTLQSLVENNDYYYQARYLDENGQEMARVDRIGDEIVVKEPEELQDKGDRYYFSETIKLQPGEIYVSPLDLNREGSPPEIEEPYKPVIRFATPIYNYDQELRGIVILNVLVDPLLDLIQGSFSADKKSYLISKNGHFLLNPDKSKEWGGPNDLDTGIDIWQDFPEIVINDMFFGESGSFDVPDKDYVIAYHHLYPDQRNKVDFLVFFEVFDRDSVWYNILRLRGILWVVFVAFALTSMVFAIVFSNSLLKPIFSLTDTTRALFKGNLKARSDIKSDDELGILAKAFNNMAEQIDKSQKILEKKVADRTRSLRQSRNTLRQQKREVNTILQSIGDGVCVLSSQGQIRIVNDMAIITTGFVKGRIINQPYDKFLNFVDDRDGTDKNNFIKKSLEMGEIQELPLYCSLVKKNGDSVPVAAISSPLKNKGGDIIGCVVTFRDVSKEREIDRFKTEFVSLASHQLRTPLSTINWYVEMLMAGDAGQLTEEQKVFLDDVYVNGQRMADLVDNLLNVSRLELGTFVVKPKLVDVKHIVKEVIEEIKSFQETKRIKIVEYYDELPKIKLDPSLIHIILQNLLSNAIKYSPAGSSVELSITKRGEYFEMRVADKGVGIPKDQQRFIFERMFRASNAREVEAIGTGLGLYIVKSILDNSGGSIRFKSEEGQGTTFFVDLPLAGMTPKG